jgi:hypothetical protein
MFATIFATNDYNFTANSVSRQLYCFFSSSRLCALAACCSAGRCGAAVAQDALPPVRAGFVLQVDALPSEHVPVPVHPGCVPQVDAPLPEHIPVPVHAGYVPQGDAPPLVHAAVVAEPASAQRPLTAVLDSTLDLLCHAAPLDPRQPGHVPHLRRS